MIYPSLLSHILEGKEYWPILASANVEQHRHKWRELFRELTNCPPKDRAIAENFHSQWHVGHHYIRQLVDDDYLLMDALWVWLPRYTGPDVLLYRGENIDRFECGKVGSGWSNSEATAKMFASGLNAVGKGGVIIRTFASASSIIAGPSKHSIYLGENEFSVDTRKLGEIVQLSQFESLD